MPSTRGITMPNLPTAPCNRILNSPVFRGWMKIRGMSFSSNPDLQQELEKGREDICKGFATNLMLKKSLALG